ncbi:hypothetical protein [Caulobacter sp. S45]|uniref:hypothetical protein n=1 Tax=Caulobacter sp. S45 TaxID=1641861 RepID=UPI00157630FD|nr:hypothetical protein [Caulobacter sp. S45]
MRTFYEIETTRGTPPGADPRVTLFLQLAVLAFWTPCGAIDLYLLWRSWGEAGAAPFVFWLLFRQALVFLALWFTVALSHGLMVGRRTPAEPRRRRRPRKVGSGQAGSIATSRYNRGQ